MPSLPLPTLDMFSLQTVRGEKSPARGGDADTPVGVGAADNDSKASESLAEKEPFQEKGSLEAGAGVVASDPLRERASVV